MRCRRVTPEQVITVEFLLTLTQWNRTHDSKGRSIRLVSIRITLQGEWFRQVILFLFFLFFLAYFLFFQFNRFIIQRSGIIAIYPISEKLEKCLHIVTDRQKFIFLTHLSHLNPTCKCYQLRPSRKTYFPDTPDITADNHIAADQLIAFCPRDKAYPVIEIIGISHHTIYLIFIIFLSVLGKRRQ